MGFNITEATWQGDDIKPPRLGAYVALAVDATSRAYDLTLLNFNGFQWNNHVDNVYLTLRNDSPSTNIYYAFNGVTGTIDPTSITAAGSALAFGASQCDFIPPNGAVNVRIRRDQDKFLILRTSSGTSTLRFGASSEDTPQPL